MTSRFRPSLAMLTATAVCCGLAGMPPVPAYGAEPATKPTTSPLLETLVRLDNPSGMEYLPDGQLLIGEKPGRLRIWRNGSLSAPVTGLPNIAAGGQGGLLDVAVDPSFQSNRWVYLAYSEAAAVQPGGTDVSDSRLGIYQDLNDAVVKGLAVARGRLQEGALTDVQVIWRAVPKTVGRGHFAGRLAFANDGTLLITSGDRQRFEPAQDLSSDLGKILRIRTDGSIPPDNPFANGPQAHRDVWSYGHRNTLGLVVDNANGDVWINEMGPMHGDEFGRVTPGGNHGWPLVSEGDHYDGRGMPRSSSRRELMPPLTAWWPAISPSGMVRYSSNVYPSWQGSFLIGGLSSTSITRVTLRPSGRPDVESIYIGLRVRDLITAPDGQLLVLTDGDNGALTRLLPEKLAVRP